MDDRIAFIAVLIELAPDPNSCTSIKSLTNSSTMKNSRSLTSSLRGFLG